jgi:hypothetical protein
MTPDHEVSHGTRLKKRTEDDTVLASESTAHLEAGRYHGRTRA